MSKQTSFNIGDTVCTYNNHKGTVLEVNHDENNPLNSKVVVRWDDNTLWSQSYDNIWLESDTPKYNYANEQMRIEFDEKQKNAAEQRVIERAFDEEIKAYRYCQKYNVGDRVHWEQYGCGTVLEASPHVLTVMFANDYERVVSAYPPLRFATVEDEQYDPCAVMFVPEPVKEDATVERLEKEVARWAHVVQCLDGNEDDEDIKHDLFARECVHGLLNGVKAQGVAIPADLLAKLAQADQHFIENSVLDSAPDIKELKKRIPCDGPVWVQDIEAFWYQYRWPKVKQK